MSESVAVTSAPAAAGTTPAAAGTTQVLAPVAKPAAKPTEDTSRAGRLSARGVKAAPLPGVSVRARAQEPAAKSAEPGASGDAVGDDAKAAADASAAKATKRPAGEGYSARRIAELEKEVETLKGSKTGRDELIAELQSDPGKLFALIKDPDLLLKLAEAKGKGEDPKEAIKSAIEDATKPLREKLEGKEKEDAKRAQEQRQAETLNATRIVFKDGYKEGDEVVADPAKWTLSRRLTDAGVIDAPAEAMKTVTRLAADIQKKQKEKGQPPRTFSNKEAATMLAVALDAIEKREQTKAKHYAPDSAASGEKGKDNEAEKTEGNPAAKTFRRTLTSRVGYGQTVGREDPNATVPKNGFQRRQQRLARLNH